MKFTFEICVGTLRVHLCGPDTDTDNNADTDTYSLCPLYTATCLVVCPFSRGHGTQHIIVKMLYDQEHNLIIWYPYNIMV